MEILPNFSPKLCYLQLSIFDASDLIERFRCRDEGKEGQSFEIILISDIFKSHFAKPSRVKIDMFSKNWTHRRTFNMPKYRINMNEFRIFPLN